MGLVKVEEVPHVLPQDSSVIALQEIEAVLVDDHDLGILPLRVAR